MFDMEHQVTGHAPSNLVDLPRRTEADRRRSHSMVAGFVVIVVEVGIRNTTSMWRTCGALPAELFTRTGPRYREDCGSLSLNHHADAMLNVKQMR